jgi:hypothetical protein
MKSIRFLLRSVIHTLLLIFWSAVVIQADPVTIDFQTFGSGKPFDGNFFENQGVTFSPGYFVGFVQGRAALVSIGDASDMQIIRGGFTPAVTSLAITLAPASQGTAFYTLSVFDGSFNLISSVSLSVTQEPFGYFVISLAELPAAARSFSLQSRLVSSPGGINTMEFAIGSLTLTPVPEPGTLLLLGSGGLIVLIRRKW